MSRNNMYEYENESSIDPKLICAICLNPFNEPKLISCGHIYCDYCIKIWFEKNLSCPICRQVLTKKQFKSVTKQNILNKLDQLEVQCVLCQQMGIKRIDFDYHIDNKCPKVIVSCSTAGVNCSWKGPRADLDSHQTIYFYEHTRDTLIHQLKSNKKDSKLISSHLSNIESLINQYPLCSKISLRDEQITDFDMAIVIKLAIMDKQCKILDLGNNRIIFQGVSLLAESLRNNTTLKMISLHQNFVSEMGIRSISQILSLNNSVLKWLDLESTKLTDKSVQYLAEMLKVNKSITGLWLSSNRIGYRGVQVLSVSLIYFNTTLKHLDLENNRSINDSCMDCLIGILRENRSLKTFYLNNCQLSATSKAKLRDIAHKKQNFRLFL